MNIFIRADASSDIGSGHIMRCMALARSIRQRGGHVHFICRELPGHLYDLVTDNGYSIDILAAPDHPDQSGLPHRTEIEQTLDILSNQGPADWLIVDSYELDIQWEQAMRPVTNKILVLDDLPDREHDCDIWINPSLTTPVNDRHAVDYPCLQGPGYAPLQQEFARLRLDPKTPPSLPLRLLVFPGGADAHDVTSIAIEAAIQFPTTSLGIDVVVGSSNPRADEIKTRCLQYENIRFHHNTRQMAELMQQADLSIGAGGGASWERCCLGLPCILISQNEYQQPVNRYIAAHDAGIDLGPATALSREAVVDAINRFIHSPEKLESFSGNARHLADGLGSERIVRHMELPKPAVTVVSDTDSWINSFIPGFLEKLKTEAGAVHWVHETRQIPDSYFTFLLGCGTKIPGDVLDKSRHTLVVHESDLPQGRGWSPLSWQIIEGKNNIPVTLFEAAAEIDSGPIYSRTTLHFQGDELVDELRTKQAEASFELCLNFILDYPESAAHARPQQGEADYYNRRTPSDSRLDPEKSLREQLNLLRTVDNERYPAYFEIGGTRYTVKISKD